MHDPDSQHKTDALENFNWNYENKKNKNNENQIQNRLFYICDFVIYLYFTCSLYQEKRENIYKENISAEERRNFQYQQEET